MRKRAKHLLVYDHMFVSQVILSGIILGPHVDQLIKHVLVCGFKVDDAIMSPLLGSEKPSAVRIIIDHTYYILSSGTSHS
jgi:hypothetical protein